MMLDLDITALDVLRLPLPEAHKIPDGNGKVVAGKIYCLLRRTWTAWKCKKTKKRTR